jgi:hypothetical protein
MYWWRIDDLRAELIAGTMTERTRFYYVMADAVLTTLVTESGTGWHDAWDAVLSVIAIVSTIVGTGWVFRLNGGGRGRNFVERYLALGFVVMIRVLAAAIPIMVAAILVPAILGHPLSESTGPIDFVVVHGLMVAFWIVLGREMRRVAEGSSTVMVAGA